MKKNIGWIILFLFLTIIFITPVRDYINNLLLHKNKSELEEEQLIGIASGYNVRVKEIQGILKNAGLDFGPIDGMIGNRTRQAIKEFQKAKNLRVTGKIDSDTQLMLTREKEAYEQIGRAESKVDLYLEEVGQTGYVIESSKMDSADVKRKIKLQDEIISYRLESKGRIKQIQIALKKGGFYNGEIDGKLGLQTKKAIKIFQKSKGLNPDGIVGPMTWKALSEYLN